MRDDEALFPWLESSWSQLEAYIKNNRIPQALIVTGKKGLGKRQLAHEFAKSLLCQQQTSDYQACDQCQSCKLLIAQTHPDLCVVQPDEPGKKITINQIRKLISFLSLTSQYGTNRLIIIHDAEQMNNAAANSFLKCLEEPAERTTIILVSDNPHTLPATVISRCQKLKINAPKPEQAKPWLQQHLSGDSDLDTLLSLSQGAPLLAQEYANDQILTLRKSCFTAWLDIAESRVNPVIIAEQWLQLSDSMLLFWLTTWVTDIIKCYFHHNPVDCYNSDFTHHLQELAQRLELKKLFKYYDLLLRQKHNLSTQLNKQLIFEEILINWSQITRVK
jgi:DNA polymerase-3 subunit delta'